jgi:ABC-type branched-subunit amino acid transport system permease subunit
VNPEIASWHQSGNAMLMVILGGVGISAGAVLGCMLVLCRRRPPNRTHAAGRPYEHDPIGRYSMRKASRGDLAG